MLEQRGIGNPGVLSPRGRLLLTGLCILALALGCARPWARSEAVTGGGARLESGALVFVSRPLVSERSLAAAAAFKPELAGSFARALAPHASRVVLAGGVDVLEPSLASASLAGARYLFMPSLFQARLLGEGSADLEFYYSVFEVGSGRRLAMRFMRVNSAGLPPAAAGAFLVKALSEDVSSLFLPVAAAEKKP
jgi:hypothetical protein